MCVSVYYYAILGKVRMTSSPPVIVTTENRLCVCVCHTLTKSAMLLNSGQTLVTVLYHRDQCHTISPDLHQSEAHLWLIIKLHNTSVRHYWKVEISTQTQSHSRSYATLNFK